MNPFDSLTEYITYNTFACKKKWHPIPCIAELLVKFKRKKGFCSKTPMRTMKTENKMRAFCIEAKGKINCKTSVLFGIMVLIAKGRTVAAAFNTPFYNSNTLRFYTQT